MTDTPQKNFTILLVDDRPENLVSLEEMLEAPNRTIIKATSGNEALKLILKNEHIGLIMLDVQMPGMDGFEVARILQSNTKTKEIAIIFVTAISKTEHNVLQGFNEGAVDYLQKPLDVNVTLAKVKVFEKLYFYQRELKYANNEVLRINKQLERFVYIVSHDLKSPLASIVTMLSIVKKHQNITTDARLLENMDMVYMASNHLSDMIGSLLEYSRQSYNQQVIEEVDTRLLVSEVCLLLMVPAFVKVTIGDNLPVLHTRRFKLQQVFQNLLSNAIKYIDKAQGLIEINAVEKPNHYVFSVTDNGPGIANKDKDRIFNLFQVEDNEARGESKTGIGLNILKMIVEEQGGKIWVNSNPGVGSTFYFEWSK